MLIDENEKAYEFINKAIKLNDMHVGNWISLASLDLKVG